MISSVSSGVNSRSCMKRAGNKRAESRRESKMTLIFFWGGRGGEEVRWKTVRTYGKILATPLSTHANS